MEMAIRKVEDKLLVQEKLFKAKFEKQNERIRELELMVENLLKRVEQLESSGLFI